MYMTDSHQNEASLKTLTSQAVTLAAELSQALDKKNHDSHQSLGQIRTLAGRALNSNSQIEVMLLEKDEDPRQ
jgi:hypothetical protein